MQSSYCALLHSSHRYFTSLIQIIGVEHILRQCGKLKTIAELKEFWEQMLSPLQPPPEQSKRRESSPRALSVAEEIEWKQLEEEGFTNSWAITAETGKVRKNN